MDLINLSPLFSFDVSTVNMIITELLFSLCRLVLSWLVICNFPCFRVLIGLMILLCFSLFRLSLRFGLSFFGLSLGLGMSFGLGLGLGLCVCLGLGMCFWLSVSFGFGMGLRLGMGLWLGVGLRLGLSFWLSLGLRLGLGLGLGLLFRLRLGLGWGLSFRVCLILGRLGLILSLLRNIFGSSLVLLSRLVFRVVSKILG